MESTSVVASQDRKYNTNYNGGVFFLNASDYISVRSPDSKFYFMKSSASYFGAFLIHPAIN